MRCRQPSSRVKPNPGAAQDPLDRPSSRQSLHRTSKGSPQLMRLPSGGSIPTGEFASIPVRSPNHGPERVGALGSHLPCLPLPACGVNNGLKGLLKKPVSKEDNGDRGYWILAGMGNLRHANDVEDKAAGHLAIFNSPGCRK